MGVERCRDQVLVHNTVKQSRQVSTSTLPIASARSHQKHAHKLATGFGTDASLAAGLFLQVPPELQQLKHDVESFATRFPTIGFEKAQMRYKS